MLCCKDIQQVSRYETRSEDAIVSTCTQAKTTGVRYQHLASPDRDTVLSGHAFRFMHGWSHLTRIITWRGKQVGVLMAMSRASPLAHEPGRSSSIVSQP